MNHKSHYNITTVKKYTAMIKHNNFLHKSSFDGFHSVSLKVHLMNSSVTVAEIPINVQMCRKATGKLFA